MMKREYDNTIMQECNNATMLQCRRGEGFSTDASLSDSLFLISYFLFSENVKYRIRNQKSGSFIPALKEQLISAPGNALGWSAYEIQFSRQYDLPYYSRLSGGKTRRMEGREVNQRLSPTARRGYREGPVIHREQAVRACLLPFFTFFLINN